MLASTEKIEFDIARSSEQPWDDERRDDPRIPVHQEAVIEHAGASHSVIVINISGGGARIKCDEALTSGQIIELATREWGRFRCEVRNVDNDGAGLMFLEELDGAE